MKKHTIKAFTLVEMLIVIVIIGILIASLMPRMQTAQWRARDVARKNDLSQVQTAIISSQSDRWYWPWLASRTASTWSWTTWMKISEISQALLDAWMTSVPQDPNGSNPVDWLWSAVATWEYIYLIAKRNWTPNAGFALMASTEVEWSSNWVKCSTGTDLSGWKIVNGDDLANITLCSTITKGNDCASNRSGCTYTTTSELRYLLLY